MSPSLGQPLHVEQIIADVYRLTARHLGDLLRYAWPWLLLLFAVSSVLYWSLYPFEKASIEAGGAGSGALIALSGIASVAIGAMIAVPWHRMILLNEKQTLPESLSISPLKISYFVTAILLMLAMVAPMWTASIALELLGPRPDAELGLADLASGFLFVAGIVWIALLTRLWLILPAIAVGRKELDLKTVWHVTRGNTLRIAFASLVATILPYFIVGLALTVVMPDAFHASSAGKPTTREAFAAFHVATELVAMLLGMLFVTFLSLAYRHFFEPRSDTHKAPDAG